MAAVVASVVGKSNNGFGPPTPEGEVFFRTSLGDRAPIALFALAFFGGGLLVVGAMIDPMGKGGGAGIFMLLPTLAFALWLVRCAGPEEVRLDLKARTYRRMTGWPLFPTVLSGPMRHIFGVYMQRIGPTSSSRAYYLVGLYWSGTRGKTVVGYYDRREGAEAEAERLQSVLELPRVSAPR